MKNEKTFCCRLALSGEPLIYRNGEPVGEKFVYDGATHYPYRVGDRYYNAAGRRSESREDQFDLFMARKPVQSAHGAIGLLESAAGHMRDRAKTYEQPEGERSMAKTVAAFNAITGQELTETQGWLFMACLKNVRAFSVKTPHRDSLEDGIAYQALMAESILR